MIKINKITNSLFLEINRLLYVVNFLICYSSKNMAIIESKKPTMYQQDIKMIYEKGIQNFEEQNQMLFCQTHKMRNHFAII